MTNDNINPHFRKIAHDIVQKHMDRAGVIGCWEALEDRIAAELQAAYSDARLGLLPI